MFSRIGFPLPFSLRGWLPEIELRYFVSEIIDLLVLGESKAYYEREDRVYRPDYPRMMANVLVYNYCVGYPLQFMASRAMLVSAWLSRTMSAR